MNETTQREDADSAAMRRHLLPIPEHCTQAGALALAQRLNAYWHSRGHLNVRHWIEPITLAERTRPLSDVEAAKLTVFAVRSNLVNGTPPKGA
jgi:hypothetical protein